MDVGSEVASIEMPMDFLMWVMDVREQLEAVEQSAPKLESLRAELQEQLEINAAALTAAFERVGAGEEGAIEEAQELTAVLQYLQRIQAEIHAKSAAE